MPCFLSTIQSPIQALLRPAVWLPGINRLHSHREQWIAMSGTADQLVDELIQAVDTVAEADQRTTYAVKKVDRDKHRVQIYNWTWAEWLDVVEIEFRDGANGGVEAKCHSFSSGLLPTWIPLCFIFNVIFFFIPFYDNKFNSTRLERLRVAMETECRLVPKDQKKPSETTPILSENTPAKSRENPDSPTTSKYESSTNDPPTSQVSTEAEHSWRNSDENDQLSQVQEAAIIEISPESPPAPVIHMENEPEVDPGSEEKTTDIVIV